MSEEPRNNIDSETMVHRLAAYVDQIQPVIQLTGSLQEQIEKLKKENELIIKENCRLTLLNEDLKKDLKEAMRDANKWRDQRDKLEQKAEQLRKKYFEGKEKYEELQERFDKMLEDRNDMIRASEAAYDHVEECLQAIANEVARPSDWELDGLASDWDISDPVEEEDEEDTE